MTFWWLLIFIVLLLIEICTVNLVSIWFAIGALASFAVSFITENIIIQLVCFIIMSFIVLLATKPIVRKVKTKKEYTNLDRVVGMDGIVTEEISKFKIGEVKVDGKKWSAKSDDKIEKDSIVKIEKIDGVKLIVRKKEC